VRDEQLIGVLKFFAGHFRHPLPAPLLQLHVAFDFFTIFPRFLLGFFLNLPDSFRFDPLLALRSFLSALRLFLVRGAGDYFVLGAGESPRVQLGHVGEGVGEVVVLGNLKSPPRFRGFQVFDAAIRLVRIGADV